MFQRTDENNRQERDWSIPTHVGERNNTQQESQLPLTPLPSRFSDWSSLGSPHARTTPHGVSDREAPDREVEQNVNMPNQLNVQSGTVPRQEIIRINSLEEVIIPPPSTQQVEEQSVHAIDMEPNPLSIEVGMQREDVETGGKQNIPIIQTSKSVIPPIGVDELRPSPNVPPVTEDMYNTSRDSSVRDEEIYLRKISNIPPVDRITSSRERRIISEDMSIG